MNARAQMRQLRKQSLRLQARRHRLAMRHELSSLSEPLAGSGAGLGAEQWLAVAASVLSVLPGRWGRLLSVGALAWRLVKRSLSARKAEPVDSP